MLVAPQVRHQRLAEVLGGTHDHVVVVGGAEARLEEEPPLLLPRRHDRVAQPLGRPGELGAGRQPERLLDLGRRLPRQAEDAERQARVEPGQLLELGVGRATAAEGGERAAIVLLPVAQESDVIAEAVELGARLEQRLEDLLGLLEFLLREVDQTELEGDRRVLRRLRLRPLQERGGQIGPPLRRVDGAGEIERLDVIGFELEGAAQVRERLVVPLLVEVEHGLCHVDVSFGGLGERDRPMARDQDESRDEHHPRDDADHIRVIPESPRTNQTGRSFNAPGTRPARRPASADRRAKGSGSSAR